MSPIIKRKGEKFTLPSKYLLFILTILCAGLMILTFSTDVLDKPVNAVAGYVIVPFQIVYAIVYSNIILRITSHFVNGSLTARNISQGLSDEERREISYCRIIILQIPPINIIYKEQRVTMRSKR